MSSTLDAINTLLNSIGEAPVTSADSQHPDVIAAKVILIKTSREIQSFGWWFNREFFTLVPNTSKELTLPGKTLSVDPSNRYLDYVQRGNRLYDLKNNSYKFNDSIRVEILIELDYDQLPFHAQNYIQYTAAGEMQNNFEGDTGKLQFLAQKAEFARQTLLKEELRNSDNNAMDRPTVINALYRVRPYRGSGSINPRFAGGVYR